MSTSIPEERRSHRIRNILFAIGAAVVVVALTLVAIFVVVPAVQNNDASPQVTESAEPTPGATEDPGSGNTDPGDGSEWVDESSAFSQWTYPVRYFKIASEAGFGKATINDQDIPAMMMGTVQDDNNTIDQTTWPDSTGPALTSKSASGVVLQTIVYADDCAMYAITMQNIPSLREYRSWLVKHFPTDYKKVNDWAFKAVSGSDEEKLAAVKACAVVAGIWEDLTDLGVLNNITTSLNVHAVREFNPYAPFTTAPEFELNPNQYTGEFVGFADVDKGQPWVCEDLILVNPGDGRIALPNCETVVVANNCVGTCGGWVCPYPLNADGQCIPPKTVDYSQSHPIYKPPAQDDGVKPAPPAVIVVIPDDDSGDETGGGNGTVGDN
jgi:hypothetical protein